MLDHPRLVEGADVVLTCGGASRSTSTAGESMPSSIASVPIMWATLAATSQPGSGVGAFQSVVVELGEQLAGARPHVGEGVDGRLLVDDGEAHRVLRVGCWSGT